MDSHLAFRLSRSEVKDRILVPKFYDPDLEAASALAEQSGFDLPELGDLLLGDARGSRLGDWVPREHYGTGPVPYVRTSDLWHWRIRADFKQGVSQAVFDQLKEKQDVQVDDLLLVAHGTYLVGVAAIVTEDALPLVLQDHVFRLRVDPASGVSPYLLLAALSTAFVKRQVRSRQFSADIIDKIGERHLGIRVPIPRDSAAARAVAERVQDLLRRQSQVAQSLAHVVGADMRMTRRRPEARHGFTVARSAIAGRVLIPSYYDPILEAELEERKAADVQPWTTVGELVDRGWLAADTGVEVGKMAYGTGAIPFVRTSDLAGWELRRETRQGISEEIFRQYEAAASLRSEDILVVRDGTYLVGSSVMLAPDDPPAIYCGGLYRLRVLDSDRIDPYALLAYLSMPLSRRQMRARQFCRDVIDTLGERLMEVAIPLPDPTSCEAIATSSRAIVMEKADIKRQIVSAVDKLEPPSPPAALGRPAWSMR